MGTDEIELDEDDDAIGERVVCSYCGGEGITIEGFDCDECDGLGYWDY